MTEARSFESEHPCAWWGITTHQLPRHGSERHCRGQVVPNGSTSPAGSAKGTRRHAANKRPQVVEGHHDDCGIYFSALGDVFHAPEIFGDFSDKSIARWEILPHP